MVIFRQIGASRTFTVYNGEATTHPAGSSFISVTGTPYSIEVFRQTVENSPTARYDRLKLFLNTNSDTTDSTHAFRINNVTTVLLITIPNSTTGVFSDLVNSVTTEEDDLFCLITIKGSGVGTLQYNGGSLRVSN